MNFLASNYERMNQGVRQLYLDAVDLTPKAPESVSLYTCFAWLWAINELLHRLRFPSDSLMQWVVLVAVAAVLWRPRSTLGLLALAVSAAVDYLLSLPQVSNFLTLVFFANISLILSIAAHGWKALPGLTVSTDGPRHHWLARKLLATHPVPTEEWDRLHRTPAKSHIHEIPSRFE